MKATRISLLIAGMSMLVTAFCVPEDLCLPGIGPGNPSRQVKESEDHPEFCASPAEIPRRLQSIVGRMETPIEQRIRSARSLEGDLTEVEVLALSAFLKSPSHGRETNLPGLRALKNDILNALRHQQKPPAILTEILIHIYRDECQDEVLRDYAIQHLVAWYQQGAAEGPAGRQQIRAVLAEAARQKSPVAATALLGMHRLSASDSAFGIETDHLALALMRSPATDPVARITVIQICAERGLKEALPAIQGLAQAPGSISLRLSAIAALGRLGNQEHITVLQQLNSDANELLRAAIRGALKQLYQKQQLS